MQKFQVPSFKFHESGFTIIEILIVAAISVSIIFAVSSFAGNLGMLQNLVGQTLQSRGDIDQDVQIMTSELRSMGPSGLGSYAIESASTGTLVFYGDIDKDGVFERVRYFVGATSMIEKGVTKPAGNPLVYNTSTETVISWVNNMIMRSSTPLFTYYGSTYNGTGTALSSPIDVSSVRVIKIQFYADVNPSSSPAAEFFSDEITPRNLRTN